MVPEVDKLQLESYFHLMLQNWKDITR